FLIINTLFLAKPQGYKSSLVPHYQPIFTLLVLENPLGSNGVTSRRRLNQNPNLIPFKIFEFLMHGIDPIGVRKSMSNMFGLKRGNKRRMSKASDTCYLRPCDSL